MSPCHPAGVTLSPGQCHPVTWPVSACCPAGVTLSPGRCHPVTWPVSACCPAGVTLSPSRCHILTWPASPCHPAGVTLSPGRCHPVTRPVSPCHPAGVTLPPGRCHPVTRTVSPCHPAGVIRLVSLGCAHQAIPVHVRMCSMCPHVQCIYNRLIVRVTPPKQRDKPAILHSARTCVVTLFHCGIEACHRFCNGVDVDVGW